MNDTAPLHHNRPPGDLLLGEALREWLADSHATLIKRRDELTSAFERAPDEIDNDDMAQKVGDYIKQLSALMKAAEGARVADKEPYLEGGRGVDGWFKRTVIDPISTIKTDVERRLTLYLRKKEEDERRRRQEEERRAREEAERRRQEAQEAERRLRDERSLEEAVAREKAAREAEADRIAAEKAARAKPADLSRVRSDYGALSSLRTDWTFEALDRDALDLEALRQHIPADGLERAVRAFVKAGGRELRGVRIFETTSAVVR